MATRSTIAIKLNDNEYLASYCHWDGYLSHNGKLLFENYNTEEKVRALIELGSISSLEKSIEKPEGHSFEHKKENCSVFYHRDRGEEWKYTKPVILNSEKELIKHAESYLYLFQDGKWFWTSHNRTLVELTKEITEIAKNE